MNWTCTEADGSSLASRRTDVNDSIYHLIISLDETGCQAVLETKGLIELTCNNSGRRFAYLAIDTDTTETGPKGMKSSDKTGEVCYLQNELCFLDASGCKDIFSKRNINTVRSADPTLFTWVDTSLTPRGASNGAEQCRQIGRLILHKNYALLKDRISMQ